MVELLVRTIDSYANTGDPVFDSKVSRRGDVIAAMPDGWGWGDKEMSHPFWRIIKLPNCSQAIGATLTAPEIATALDPTSPTLQFRAHKFNLDDPTLPADMQAYIADDKRAATTYTSETMTDLTASPLIVTKPAISIAVGDAPTVFG